MTLRAWRTAAAAILLAFFVVAPVFAQVAYQGRIDVTVEDATGARLPGVSVELTGPMKQTAVTDPRGEAHFLNLNVGTYQVTATLQGFNEYKNTNVQVVAGSNAPLAIKLSLAGTQETVQVTAETPLIDTKKTGTTTSVTLEELQNIPTARDPWVVLQTVPGIITDRVNVGGSESGQQSGYQAKGASGADATWNMDGIPITDMAATGSTPTYYDFDMFQEMNVTTGGSDLNSGTGGVHLNFILKSGTNVWHGSSRMYFEDEAMQSTNMDTALATRLKSPNGKGNRTSQYADYGFEVGGPLLRDRLWAWGSLGKTDVRILTIKQTPDRTILKNRAFKTQAQLTHSLRGSFTYFFGDKNKFGRDASATRPPETTYNQKGPSSFYKGEVNWTATNNLFLTARVSDFPSGFSFDPQGGMNKNVYRDDDKVWHGSYWNYYSDRPQQTVVADGSYFHGSHELKFGFSWRRVTVDSTSEVSSASGHKMVTYHIGYPDMAVDFVSPWTSKARAFYTSLWLGDTISLDRLTLNGGLRFDRQTDSPLAMSEPAVPGVEQYLPAISAKAVSAGLAWNSLSPRLGFSYALDEGKKTLFRGSYAKFASQLGNGASSFLSSVGYRYIEFYAYDANGNKVADYDEVDFSSVWAHDGFDIDNPAKLESINKAGSYGVPRTHEVLFGLDREIVPNFSVSGAFTYRKLTNFNWSPRIGVTRADYIVAGTLSGTGLPDGSSYSVDYYKLDPANVADMNAAQGTEYKTREGYHQRFVGWEISGTKRMSNRWMARFGFSTNVHKQYFDDPDTSITDPTPGPEQNYTNGGLVVTASGGSGKSGIYQLLPKYQFSANGLFQAPAGIDLGFSLLTRQGFGQAWYRGSVDTDPDGEDGPVLGDPFSQLKNVAVYKDIDKNRLPAVTTFDARVSWNPAKLFNVRRVGLNIDLDIFNLFNSGTVLGRQYDISASSFDQVLEIMNPRIARLGVRFTF